MVSNTRRAAGGSPQKVLDTSDLNICPRCRETGGFMQFRPVQNGKTPKVYHYYYWVHGGGNNGTRRSCYLGKNPNKWLRSGVREVSNTKEGH